MSSNKRTVVIVIFRPAFAADAAPLPAENRLVVRLETLLNRNGVPHEIWRPATLGEAGDMARKASGASPIVAAAGGDGTINAVSGGLLGTECRLGILPIGSGNDIARGLRIPRKLPAAVALLADGYRLLKSDMESSGNEFTDAEFTDAESTDAESTGNESSGKKSAALIRKIDAGVFTSVNETDAASGRSRQYECHFINTLGFGFDGRVAWNASRLRFLRGKWKYLGGVLQSLLFYRATDMTITADGETYSGRYLMTTVANGPFEGGGIPVAPRADPGDGLFDLVMIHDTGVFARIPLLLRVLLFGASDSTDIRLRQCHTVRVTSSRPVMAHADGEVISRNLTEFSATIRPAQLAVIGPATP
ncbi:MAG: hypothetical protein EA363_13460 [Balneolaceae bacterium]|nr:MAG: hypothetical protein EA363_13460 [Balneolaceae bacterium]